MRLTRIITPELFKKRLPKAGDCFENLKTLKILENFKSKAKREI
jgi:hypothetical protein